MKRLIIIFSIIVLLSGCIQNQNNDNDINQGIDVNIVALNGPTAMGLINFIDKSNNKEITTNNYKFTIKKSIDEVTTMIAKNQVDIATVPANLASILYNNTKENIQVLAINTLGVLYILENGNTIKDINDLKGKTIYAAGKGATPEYVLNKILDQAGILDSITIEYKSEQIEVMNALLNKPNAIAMLPQPVATNAKIKNKDINIALDLTKIWEQLSIKGSIITGVTIINKEFAKNNPIVVEDFLTNYQDSVNLINNDIEQGSTLVEKYDIIPKPIALQAIPLCNITLIKNKQMYDDLSSYLKVLYQQNPKSIGGSLPKENFYYNINE